MICRRDQIRPLVAASLIAAAIGLPAPCARRPGLHGVPAVAVAGGAAARRLARDLRRGDARARARSVAARSRHSRAGGSSSRGQAEFVQTPADYLQGGRHSTRLAAQGRKLLRRSIARRSTRIEQRFGVPGPIVLAIWGRETDYRPLQAAARRDPRAGDPGLYGPAQGPCSATSSCWR